MGNNTRDTNFKTSPSGTCGGGVGCGQHQPHMDNDELSGFESHKSYKTKSCSKCGTMFGGHKSGMIYMIILVLTTFFATAIPSVLADPKVKVSKVLVSTTTGKVFSNWIAVCTWFQFLQEPFLNGPWWGPFPAIIIHNPTWEGLIPVKIWQLFL